MEEIWKDIKSFGGYQVSSLGRVRTHNKVTFNPRHGKRVWKDRILKFKKCSKKVGNRVDLWKDGKPYTFLVHRLVATTFLEDLIDSDMTVNHKDGNRYNNNVENLEWLSRADNIRYGFSTHEYDKVKRKVKLIDESGNEFIFDSCRNADRFLGKKAVYVANCISGKRKIAYSQKGNFIIKTF